MTNHLYLIRGLPGSGKSTLARKMLECGMVSRHFEADQYHMISTLDGIKYDWKPENVKFAHEWCLRSARLGLNLGDVAVSNTFTQLWELQPYMDLGYPYTIITVNGKFQNIHNVPPEAIERMRARWENV